MLLLTCDARSSFARNDGGLPIKNPDGRLSSFFGCVVWLEIRFLFEIGCRRDGKRQKAGGGRT